MKGGIVTPAVFVTLAGIVLSTVLVPVLSRFGLRWGLLDYPGGRKQHDHSVPLAGGPAIVAAGYIALVTAAIWLKNDYGFSGWFLLGADMQAPGRRVGRGRDEANARNERGRADGNG